MTPDLSPQTTLFAQRHQRPYLIQWERMLRWQQRLPDATKGEADEAIDFALALFGAIFQMRDWLRASRPDLAADVEALYRDSPDLSLVRDLANGAKHMTLHHYVVDGAATVAREYAGSERSRLVVLRPGGRNVECAQLAGACIAEMRAFMEEQSLL